MPGVRAPKRGTVVRGRTARPATTRGQAAAAALVRAGEGVRKKQVAFIGVDVYRVALEVDADAWIQAREAGVGIDSATDCEKALEIRMLRDVDANTFFDALSSALDPRIRGIATNLATSENDEGNFMAATAEAAEVEEEAAFDALGELRACIGDLRKGDVVRLACKGASVTVTSPNGAQTELTSTVFHSALVATFTDEKAVSEEARDNIGAALAAL